MSKIDGTAVMLFNNDARPCAVSISISNYKYNLLVVVLN